MQRQIQKQGLRVQESSKQEYLMINSSRLRHTSKSCASPVASLALQAFTFHFLLFARLHLTPQTPHLSTYLINSASFASNAGPRKFLAIKFPLGSIKKFCGILKISNFCDTALFQPFKSLTCVQVSPSALIASTHGSLVLSSDTPSTVKFLSLNLW